MIGCSSCKHIHRVPEYCGYLFYGEESEPCDCKQDRIINEMVETEIKLLERNMACCEQYCYKCTRHHILDNPCEKPEISKLLSRRIVMKSYLGMKMEEEDWHGVQDAASDLRDIDVEILTLKRMVKNGC